MLIYSYKLLRNRVIYECTLCLGFEELHNLNAVVVAICIVVWAIYLLDWLFMHRVASNLLLIWNLAILFKLCSLISGSRMICGSLYFTLTWRLDLDSVCDLWIKEIIWILVQQVFWNWVQTRSNVNQTCRGWGWSCLMRNLKVNWSDC